MSTPICCCSECSDIGTVKVDAYRRGGRSAYMCAFHANRLYGYSHENDSTFGTDKVNPWTFGIELETSYSTPKSRAEILLNGYIPTSDCTVDVEYKSPIFKGLNAISKQSVTIERLMQAGELEINDDCGTHTHVGHRTMINAVTMGYIRRFYHSLFVALSDEMQANPEKVRKLFGRDFGHWARPINNNVSPTEHTNFINTQHDNTLEFRIVKFENAKQYMAAVKFCRAAAEAVVNNFVAHFNDNDFDTKRYSNATEYRKHKASVAAKKIVVQFHKYADML